MQAPPTSKAEVKSVLQVKITGREEVNGTVFYLLRLWLIYEPNKFSKPLRKRYNDFRELNNRLMTIGFQNIP